MQKMQYDKLTDEEMVQRLMATPTENKLHDYFFSKKCYNFLLYISQTLYNEETIYHLTGEFYEFLSRNDWYVLRNWKKHNDCSLYTYLTRCAINHFTHLVKAITNAPVFSIGLGAPWELIYLQICWGSSLETMRRSYKL